MATSRNTSSLSRLWWAASTLLIVSAVSILLFFLNFGHNALRSIYEGTATGLLQRIRISGQLPLEYYLERADWLIVGLVLTMLSFWLLLIPILKPYWLSLYPNWVNKHPDHAVYSASAGVILAVVTLLLPWPFNALSLVQLLLLWISANLIFLSMPAIRKRGLGNVASWTLIVAVLGYVGYLFQNNPEALLYVFDEDTFFENLHALLSGVSGVLFLYLFVFTKKNKYNFIYLLFAMFFLFFAFEEFSWGQRIFRFSTPEFWNNAQDETTLHNLEGLNHNLILNLLMLAWGIVLPLISYLLPPIRALLKKLEFPNLPLSSSVAIIIGLVIYYISPNHLHTDEIRETFFTFAFIFFALKVFSASSRAKLSKDKSFDLNPNL